MTIRRKLSLSFGIILVLFGVNLAIYFWGATERNHSVNSLSRAMTRLTLIAGINRKLDDLHKQITLFSSISVEPGQAAASPQEIQQFKAQLAAISQQLKQLRELADPGQILDVAGLDDTFDKLSKSWTVYYQNFGVHQDVAVMELALHGDPLTDELFQRRLPEAVNAEDLRVRQAKATFARVSHITDRVSVGIFLFTLLIAFFIAFRMWRDVTSAVGELMAGANEWGRGMLDHRMAVRKDEFGQLGQSLNHMAESLLAAQEKVKQRTREIEEANRELADKNQEIEKQKKVSEDLLLNILPATVAAELQSKGFVSPKYFEDVTILFTDFVGFTRASEDLPVEELVRLLNGLFTAFDEVVKKNGLEKLKTIGDAYMCAGGIPIKNSSHPVDAVLAAFEILETVERSNRELNCPWSVRIGIHTGPIAAGVVGINKFAFDIWGDTVNFTSRLESTSVPNRINVSSATYSRIKDFFECEFRGQIETKEKKAFDMYFVKGLRADLKTAELTSLSNGFAHRYEIYFSKLPPPVPATLLSTTLRDQSVAPPYPLKA
ncbi:MAG: adenylate/guanylate cyclase domain-containing protein [Candidatus Acidiferrales bacterium]